MPKLKVKVIKSHSLLEVDTDRLPESILSVVMAEGLKVLLNRHMSKMGSPPLTMDNLTKYIAQADKIAQNNLEKLYNGEVSIRTQSIKGLSDEDNRWLRQAAKEIVSSKVT